jgi:hypothetical protein
MNCLKKIASISLLLLLVFNWCGYRFVFNWMQEKADAKLEAKLDQHNYDESELLEISVPLNMPYQTDRTDFERVDGEIEIGGIHYKYVKRKVENGQLVLKCIPNHGKQLVMNARDAFFQLVNDIQQETPAKKSTSSTGMAKLNISDYEEQIINQWGCATIAVIKNYPVPANQNFSSNNFHNSPEQPPEFTTL